MLSSSSGQVSSVSLSLRMRKQSSRLPISGVMGDVRSRTPAGSTVWPVGVMLWSSIQRASTRAWTVASSEPRLRLNHGCHPKPAGKDSSAATISIVWTRLAPARATLTVRAPSNGQSAPSPVEKRAVAAVDDSTLNAFCATVPWMACGAALTGTKYLRPSWSKTPCRIRLGHGAMMKQPIPGGSSRGSNGPAPPVSSSISSRSVWTASDRRLAPASGVYTARPNSFSRITSVFPTDLLNWCS